MSDQANVEALRVPAAMAGAGAADLRHRRLAAGAGAAALVLLFLVWPYQHWFYNSEQRTSVLYGWMRTVSVDDEWWFCFLVPALTGFLVYLQRDLLRKLPLNGSWTGLVVAALALLPYWAGFKADTGYAGFLAAQIMTAALIILLGGWQWMRALFFPWLFLAFMWPMFPIEERIVIHLRLLTAELSKNVLELIGIDVTREGTALSSAADAGRGLRQGALFNLDVEEPCSGVRSMYSLLMVSALYGYLSLKRPLPRLVLFVSAIPLAMLGNVARMVLLALGSLWFGTEFAVGRNIGGQQEMSVYHTLCGYAVFAVALTGMFGLCSLLERRHWKALKNLRPPAVASAAAMLPGAAAKSSRISHAVAAVAVGLAGIGLCSITNTQPTIAAPGVVLELPLQMGKYQGIEEGMTAVEKNVLDPGVRMVRNKYLSLDHRMIQATIIESGMGKRTLHRPEVCLPGQGWSITDRSQVPVTLPDGSSIETTVLRLRLDTESKSGQRVRFRALNIYWYIGSDGVTSPDYYDHIRISYQDALLKDMSHRWAMASFFIVLPEDGIGMNDAVAELGALEELREFAGLTAPKFMLSLQKKVAGAAE